jgi:hypothetical protein
MLYKLAESYLELWGALFNNILDSYKKAIENIKNEYQYAFLLGYSDGYKAGLLEATNN